MNSILKATRFIHQKSIGLHIAALRGEVKSKHKRAENMTLAADVARAAASEATRRAYAAHDTARQAHKLAGLVQEAAKAEAERIGGHL